MAQKQPEQSPENKRFSELVCKYLDRYGWSYAELARKSYLSKTTIHRIITNKDHRGNTYRTSVEAVAALVIAFQLTDEEANELFYAAFPQFGVWIEARDNHYSIEETNDLLFERGFPVLRE